MPVKHDLPINNLDEDFKKNKIFNNIKVIIEEMFNSFNKVHDEIALNSTVDAL
jgi:hypothetical protein